MGANSVVKALMILSIVGMMTNTTIAQGAKSQKQEKTTVIEHDS